ncbi:MAG: cytochrome c, partial [Gemmatimonadales bacterium]|nr:cytochrome c [Gemmatimonadales bacterium]
MARGCAACVLDDPRPQQRSSTGPRQRKLQPPRTPPMFTPARKKLLLAVLVLSFGVQTGLVYSDVRSEPLSQAAREGRALWQAYACQTCHQFYGQGGFLGPDLTHAASRVDSTRLVSLLTVGSGQMPPLRFSDAETAAMAAFLREMDRPEIGRGELR